MQRLLLGLFLAPAVPLGGGMAAAEPRHAIAMHGEPALPADFAHLPYANPDAPKGGAINYAWIGTFEKVIWFLFGVTLDQGFPVEFMRSTPGDTVTLRPAGKGV